MNMPMAVISARSGRRGAAGSRTGSFPLSHTRADGTPDVHSVDEGIRFDVSLEGIRGVKVIAENGKLTAASASQICDGASGVVIVNEKGLKWLGATPMAR